MPSSPRTSPSPTSHVVAGLSGTPPTVPPLSEAEGDPVGSGPDILFLDDRNGWASGTGGLVSTSDGGRTWHLDFRATPVAEGSGMFQGVGALDFIDVDHSWAVDAGTLIASTDGGHDWHPVGTPHELKGASQLHFTDPAHGWALIETSPCSPGCTTVGSLVSTRDGGATWAPVRLPGQVQAMCWASPSVGWAGGGTAVYGTTDNGRTWASFSLPSFFPTPASPDQGAGTEIITVACSGATAWIFGAQGVGMGSQGYTVDRTLDGGAHWQPILGGEGWAGLPNIDHCAGPIAAPTARVASFAGWCPACNPEATSSTVTGDAGATFRRHPVNPTGPLPGPGLIPEAISFGDATHGSILGQVTEAPGPGSGAVYH
ncbi:MAG: hypothetical protein ACRDJU_05825, partial [Actinomycetota bacterium]